MSFSRFRETNMSLHYLLRIDPAIAFGKVLRALGFRPTPSGCRLWNERLLRRGRPGPSFKNRLTLLNREVLKLHGGPASGGSPDRSGGFYHRAALPTTSPVLDFHRSTGSLGHHSARPYNTRSYTLRVW
jgi:hypothetical protein